VQQAHRSPLADGRGFAVFQQTEPQPPAFVRVYSTGYPPSQPPSLPLQSHTIYRR